MRHCPVPPRRLRFSRLTPLSLLFWIACSQAPRHSIDFRIALVPSRGGQHGIFTMNSDSTGSKLLTTDVTAQLRRSSWSPDGRKIAFFSIQRQDKGMMEKYPIPLHFPLYVMNAGGGNQRRLLDCPVSSFAWAPDSRRLLYISAYENPVAGDSDVQRRVKTPLSAIYVLDTDTGKSTRITAFGDNCSASWSPDGTRLALSLRSDGESNLYVIQPDGKQGKRLLQTSTISLGPAWSPDGKTIAFVSLPSSGTDAQEAGVYVIAVSGGDKQRITDLLINEVSWSPDGTLLMLQSGSGIYLSGRDGTGLTRLSVVRHVPRDGVFTPDGRKILFRSDADGDWNLWSADLNGTGVKRISGLSAAQYSISPATTEIF